MGANARIFFTIITKYLSGINVTPNKPLSISLLDNKSYSKDTKVISFVRSLHLCILLKGICQMDACIQILRLLHKSFIIFDVTSYSFNFSGALFRLSLPLLGRVDPQFNSFFKLNDYLKIEKKY